MAWFRRVCAALGVPPQELFRAHISALSPDLLKGPFHHAARGQVRSSVFCLVHLKGGALPSCSTRPGARVLALSSAELGFCLSLSVSVLNILSG